MKRYTLFSGTHHYPQGGMLDMDETHDDIYFLLQVFNRKQSLHSSRHKPLEWCHIYDNVNQCIVLMADNGLLRYEIKEKHEHLEQSYQSYITGALEKFCYVYPKSFHKEYDLFRGIKNSNTDSISPIGFPYIEIGTEKPDLLKVIAVDTENDQPGVYRSIVVSHGDFKPAYVFRVKGKDVQFTVREKSPEPGKRTDGLTPHLMIILPNKAREVIEVNVGDELEYLYKFTSYE